MGQFKIEIIAVGGHGCDRAAKPGDLLKRHSAPENHDPDCLAMELVEKLQQAGYDVKEAKLVHWPGTEDRVIDDLKARTRSDGNFKNY